MSTTTALQGEVTRVSLADRVHDRLLEAILSGELPSGETLKAGELAASFGVSPSPVREALLQLAAEGLIHCATNRRATVVSFTREEVADILYVREVLESAAARLAAERATDAELKSIRQAAERCAELAGNRPRKKQMLDLDNQFHLLVAAAARNEPLKADIVRYNHRVRVMQCLRLSAEATRTAVPEHLEVVEALEQRNPAAAHEAMASHIASARKLLLAGFDAV